MKRLKFTLVLIFIATYIGSELCVAQSNAKERISLSTMLPFRGMRGKTTKTTTIETTAEVTSEIIPSEEISPSSVSSETTDTLIQSSPANTEMPLTDSTIPTVCSHVWKQYNPEVDKNAPMNDGVFAGLFYDGGVAYIGSGNVGVFASQDSDGKLPGRVSINGSEKSGVYVASYESDALDTTGNASYLFNHPAYDYKWVDITEFTGNDVQFFSPIYSNVSFSRINLTEGEMEFSVIGFTMTSQNFSVYSNPVDKSLQTLTYAGFEILTCTVKDASKEVTASPVSKFCKNKWKPFDAKNPKKVERDGVFAGYYNDSSPVYVGRGYDGCLGVTPARVSTRTGSKDAGIYTTCYNTEYSDTTSYAEYLVNNTKNTYSWFPGSANQFYLNSVAWNYSGYTFVVARVGVYLNDETDDQFITIGKVYLNQGTWYYNPINSKTEMSIDDVDILICSTDGSTEPVIKYGSGCVHKWKSYSSIKNPYEPAQNGILAGKYIDSSPFYVGSGIQTDFNEVIPARVSVNGSFPPGAYVMSFGSVEYYYNKKVSYLVYNDSQLYEWKTVKYSETVINGVTLKGQYGSDFYVTRVEVTDSNMEKLGYQQIAFNYASSSTYYFNPLYNYSVFVNDYIDVLTCTIKNPQ